MVRIWKVVLVAAIIFVAGAVTGALTTRLKSSGSHPPQRGNFGSHRSQRGELMERMQRELQLSQEQRQNIEQILRESREKVKQLCDSIAPHVSEEHSKVRERIRAELTPEQREKYEQLFKRTGFKPGDPKFQFRDGKRGEKDKDGSKESKESNGNAPKQPN